MPGGDGASRGREEDEEGTQDEEVKEQRGA